MLQQRYRVLVLLSMATGAIPALGQAAGSQSLVLPPAPPIGYYADGRERLQSYVFRTYTDPMRLGWLLLDSSMDHWSRAPHHWDRSAQSFGYRFASGWGRRIVRNTAQLGFETVLHEDSRYRPSGQGALVKRFAFAVSRSVLAYKPDGSVEPMYGRMAAGVVATMTASTWHPQSTSPQRVISGVGLGAVNRASDNLLEEFTPDLKKFGRRTWNLLVRK